MKQRLVLLGPPLSGKGTLAEKLSAKLWFATAAPGAILREEAAAGTELGKRAASLTEKGNLLDDTTINSLISVWIERQRGGAFVFDGYPRTIGQASALDGLLMNRNWRVDLAVLLEADRAILENRVATRTGCRKCGRIFSTKGFQSYCSCGGELFRRSDDTVEVLEQRLAEYSEKTAPVIEFYERAGTLRRVDATTSAEDVFSAVQTFL